MEKIPELQINQAEVINSLNLDFVSKDKKMLSAKNIKLHRKFIFDDIKAIQDLIDEVIQTQYYLQIEQNRALSYGYSFVKFVQIFISRICKIREVFQQFNQIDSHYLNKDFTYDFQSLINIDHEKRILCSICASSFTRSISKMSFIF